METTISPEANTERVVAFSFSGHVYTKGIGSDARTPIVSILTYPTQDYAGDRVRPDGGDWTVYNKGVSVGGYDPNYVNWSHRIPIGRGTVKHRILKHEGRTATVAVGDTQFLYTKGDVEGLDLRRRDPRTHRSWDKEAPYTIDEVLQAAAQSERLVRDEIATGVSIEFDVDNTRKGTDWWDLSVQSMLENRPARHFENWRGLGYAHARQPVNPGCQTLSGQSSLSPRESTALEKAIVVAQTGKLPGGEVLCPVILKSFDDLRTYRSPTVSVLVEGTPPTTTNKTTDTTAPSKTVIVKGETSEGMTGNKTEEKMGGGMGEDCPSHGCRALFNAAQALMDSATALEDDAAKSDNMSLRKYAKRKASKLRDEAGDLKARAEKLKAMFDKHDEPDGDEEDPMDEDDYIPSTEEKAITTAEDGAIIVKSFPDWKPRRMTFANIVDTPVVAPVSPDPQTGPTKMEIKARNKAARKLAEVIGQVVPLLEAAQANGRL